MSKIRREKRKLKRLSTKPNYVKPYSYKVRQFNEKVRDFKKKDRKIEIAVTLGLILIATTWILMIYTK